MPAGCGVNVALPDQMPYRILARRNLDLYPSRSELVEQLDAIDQANQLTFGLSGEMKRPDGTLMQANGTSATIFPKGEVHGRGNFTKESLLLMYWDGPPDPEVTE